MYYIEYFDDLIGIVVEVFVLIVVFIGIDCDLYVFSNFYCYYFFE